MRHLRVVFIVARFWYSLQDYRKAGHCLEKRTPHYVLSSVLALVADPSMRAFTTLAMAGGVELGLTESEMRRVVLALTRQCFYKSMTTYSDHRLWQDVYYGTTSEGDAVYIKFTCREGLPPVIQFKRK